MWTVLLWVHCCKISLVWHWIYSQQRFSERFLGTPKNPLYWRHRSKAWSVLSGGQDRIQSASTTLEISPDRRMWSQKQVKKEPFFGAFVACFRTKFAWKMMRHLTCRVHVFACHFISTSLYFWPDNWDQFQLAEPKTEKKTIARSRPKPIATEMRECRWCWW